MTAPLVLLAAGGTGGHVFPAQALAAVLRARNLRLAMISDRRGDAFADMEVHCIAAGGIAGRGPLARAGAIAQLGQGTIQAFGLLRRLAPAVVVGFGGYASVPAVLAATWSGRRTLIHEQNAVLGRANRLLAPRVDRIATAFATVARIPADARVVLVGTPVRPAFLDHVAAAYTPPAGDQPVRLLVLGGSQGAHVFSELVPAAVSVLPDACRRRLRIAQQCRPEDLDAARAAYAAIGADVELATFFADVPARLRAAHLVISRAGASMVSEITVVGRPALLVPFPHAIDDHQTANARAVAAAGGAWVLDQATLTAESLAARLQALLADPPALAAAAASAARIGRADAADRLADAVCALVGENGDRRDGRAAA